MLTGPPSPDADIFMEGKWFSEYGTASVALGFSIAASLLFQAYRLQAQALSFLLIRLHYQHEIELSQLFWIEIGATVIDGFFCFLLAGQESAVFDASADSSGVGVQMLDSELAMLQD